MRFPYFAIVFIALSAHAGPGYKLSAGDGNTVSTGGYTSKSLSPADIKRKDEEAIRDMAGRKPIQGANKPSPADLKRKDEAEVKKILETQKTWEARKVELNKIVYDFASKAPDKTTSEKIKDALFDQYTEHLKGEWIGLLFGKFAKFISPALDLATPSPISSDPFDKVKTLQELEYVRKRMEEAFPKFPPPQPDAKDPPSDPKIDSEVLHQWRDPSSSTQIEIIKKHIPELIRKDLPIEAKSILNHVLDASTRYAQLSDEQIQALEEAGERLERLRPANICFVPSNQERPRSQVCTIDGLPQAQTCLCPALTTRGYDNRFWLRGVTSYRHNSNRCESVIGRCTMPSPGPIGTPCYCLPDFPLLGPLPIGRIIR